jgi:hypothetical protein
MAACSPILEVTYRERAVRAGQRGSSLAMRELMTVVIRPAAEIDMAVIPGQGAGIAADPD